MTKEEFDAKYDGIPIGGRTMEPAEQPIINPHKGWVVYGDDISFQYNPEAPFEDLSDQVWDILSVGYLRYHWVDLEPQEGRYRWNLIDNAIAQCREREKQFGFGVMNLNSTYDIGSAVPDYVWDSGAQYTTVESQDTLLDKRFTQKSPIWDDPIFMQKLQVFVKAMAYRYDGHPDIAFIDNRNYGNWGEWHMSNTSGERPPSFETIKDHVDMWKIFEKTLIVIPSNKDKAARQAVYGTNTYGCGIRRDGLLVLEGHERALRHCFGIAPAVGEYHAHWPEVITAEKLITCAEVGQITFYQMGWWAEQANDFYRKYKSTIDGLTNRLGYSFFLRIFRFIDQENGQKAIEFEVDNLGLTSLYTKATVFVALLEKGEDGTEKVVEKAPVEHIDPRTWKPNAPVEETILIPETWNPRRFNRGYSSFLASVFV